MAATVLLGVPGRKVPPYQGFWWGSVGPNQSGRIATLSHTWRQPASRSLESMGPLGLIRMVWPPRVQLEVPGLRCR